MKTQKQVVFGLIIAAMAQISAVGLLATAGWFIAASAVAGLSIFSTFIYLYPSALVRLFAVSRIGLNYWQRLLTHRSSMNQFTQERLSFFDRAADKSQLGAAVSGELVERLLNDTEQVSLGLIRVKVPLVSNVVTTIIAGIVSFFIHPILPMFFAMLIIVNIGAYVGMSWRLGKAFVENTRQAGNLRDQLIFAQASWQDLVSLGAAGRIQAAAAGQLSNYRKQTQQSANLSSDWAVGIALADVAVVGAAIMVGFQDGTIDVRNFVLLVLLSIGVFTNLLTIPANASEAAKIKLAQDRLKLNDLEPNNLSIDFEASFVGNTLRIIDYETHKTVFGGGQPIAGDFKLGDMVVLKGPSGVGKTTFFTQLTTRLTPKVVTNVTTDDYIFTGTVRDNLLLDPCVSVDDDGLTVLLNDLDLDFTLDEHIGYGGRQLSGGESTRLVVARGLLTNTPILLLDEPFAGLDAKTKRDVIRTIDKYTQTRLVFVIDHEADSEFERLATVINLGKV